MKKNHIAFTFLLGLILFTGCDTSPQQYTSLTSSCAKDIIKQNLKTVAVAPFTCMNGYKYKNYSDILTQRFKAYLSGRSKPGIFSKKDYHFLISDRSEVQILLEEQSLKRTGLLKENTVTQLGNMYSINGVVTGRYHVVENIFGYPVHVNLYINLISLQDGSVKTYEEMGLPINF